MKDLAKNCRIALVQGSPVLFNKAATVDKVVSEILAAGEQGADLIVFPESYVPCYPFGMSFGFKVGSRNEDGRKDWKVYYDHAMLVPSEDTDRIAKAARDAHAFVSLGITERDATNCSLYCTNLFFSPEGELVGKHRKIKPTGAERYIWADCHEREFMFPIVDTPWGNMGSLICWENYMPLARVALYQKGVALYVAPNTNNNPEWQDTIRHIAIEGHCYVLNCNQYVTKEMYPDSLHCPDEIAQLPQEICTGGSCIVDPYGHYVTQPVWDQEEIIYADIDMDQVPMSRMEFDATGHYSRPDILELIVHDN
ncbi:carbon-nitrogen hydrolase family protein [Sporolactobacillus sp. STSJ-5]|uniref:carbon-nitrogen hydrolase family protein n=1 Tax=Sporolactobacillus sp. STSJ-5 TaxID=2965076 RepID=UPI00210478AC|nr:carbon-nitrogen hydrolase family protein [Sporolactobacillus sp. STSJ-5]MCQ2010334.1 carbon-nitrogen hydrolase family protein [Sporolactobacillus sp. STSJ-5]